ncbi:MAG: response regulator transcription factor [Verrucomicrobia bacterium]|nr:response regulator transcription factor [Verrucomicrobiota bacterium]
MPQSSKLRPARAQSGKNIRTLIVDDSAQFRETVSTFLASLLGFEPPSEAANGEEAIRLAASHCPDLVLLDLQMPDLNGLDAMDRIRPCSPATRVIILTMHDGQIIRDVCLERGADGFVSKHGLRKELPAVIRGLFRDGTSKR